MSPFSVALRTLRARLALGQGEFAERVGYRQTYISALECGTKLPKDKNLVRKIVATLDLTSEDEAALWRAFNTSRRESLPPPGALPDAYDICAQLSELLPTLSRAQMRELSTIITSMKRDVRCTTEDGAQHDRAVKEIPM
ncbi:helix-turn-helix transcriptional regulator [Paraburkholderia sp. SARCC-3016]|uniref:helix-turn-helix domain-containing protein n=1 Tax=Paraburkholderia sp. SARCC-3016 TaxID=3058611 RepID=UPI002806F3A8|nr:helix-turn-helix transcriptional regulator [Paraburkholderia sp. SARCC-3016]MDQ7978042.1 helix-turn-helix transcriptional regulator [Paraburkholderia sp. SARCC-3016]